MANTSRAYRKLFSMRNLNSVDCGNKVNNYKLKGIQRMTKVYIFVANKYLKKKPLPRM